MGALHAGHLQLVAKAKLNNDFVICSIFVNPTQFNDPADYKHYPISIEDDIAQLIEAGCDVLFLPSTEVMYPDGLLVNNDFDFGYLETLLEGAYRPGHFKGVGQVVNRLLSIVKPQNLYMGQKDYQQCMVVKKLLEITHSTEDITLVICPTIREADGLAMSSRNRRLTEPQRVLAAVIYQCLISIQTKSHFSGFATVQKECHDLLLQKGFKPEYICLADARDLTLLQEYNAGIPMIALIAAKLGEVRLIDNLLLQA
jgi:pantoate--beta-alanine ligase